MRHTQAYSYAWWVKILLCLSLVTALLPAALLRYSARNRNASGAEVQLPYIIQGRVPTAYRVCDGEWRDSMGHWRKLDRQNLTDFQRMVAKVVPPPMKDPNKVGTLRAALGCNLKPESYRFHRVSNCEQPSPFIPARLMFENLDSITFMGDSILNQIFLSLYWMQGALKPQVKKVLKKRGIVWLCMAETPEVLDKTFEAYKILNDDTEAVAKRKDVLVLSFANWYIYKLEEPACRCNPAIDHRTCLEEDPYPPRAEAYLSCIKTLNDSQQGWTPCAKMRSEMCFKRIGRNGLNQCSLVRDLVLLARWINTHRARLPKYIFWVDPTPVHLPGVEQRASDWHDRVGRTVWSKFAPHVKIIRTYDLLVDQTQPHPPQDGFHWCYKSDAFETYVASVLSAIMLNVTPEAMRTRRHDIGELGRPSSVSGGNGDR